MSSRALEFLEGDIRYPEDLPCPEIDTDLKPRERRYISDIGQVKKYRRFQRTYQATRQNISFVFTAEQAARFQDWYAFSIIEGGAWFYADWPILHKEKDIAYRFVTRPVWTFLARGNFHVSATVELDEGRKVGRYVNVFTTKLYPYRFNEGMRVLHTLPEGKWAPASVQADDAQIHPHTIVAGAWTSRLKTYTMQPDDAAIYPHIIVEGAWTSRLKRYEMQPDDAVIYPHSIVVGAWTSRLVSYDYAKDDATIYPHTIVAGEWT